MILCNIVHEMIYALCKSRVWRQSPYFRRTGNVIIVVIWEARFSHSVQIQVGQPENYFPWPAFTRVVWGYSFLSSTVNAGGSSASCCDCYVIDTWSTWSWIWLAIADSPLPPKIANGAGYDDLRTAFHRDLSYLPSLQHIHFWPVKHCLQKVCICWRSRNHACLWRQAGSGRGSGKGHGNRW